MFKWRKDKPGKFNTLTSDLWNSMRLDSLGASFRSKTATGTIPKIRNEVTETRNYRVKVCLTWFIIVSIIVGTWVLFIATLCVSIYSLLLPTLKVPEVSENDTFLDTFSGSNSCPYTASQALAKFHIYQTWFQFVSSNQSGLNSTYGALISNTTCVARFVNNNTQCTPECLSFAPGGDEYFIAWRVFVFSGAFISFVVSLLGIATWLKIGGTLWDFPHIIFFYLILSVLVQSVCILSGQILPQPFYCKHLSLFESRTDTTIQCNIQGAIFHYSLMVFLYWYLFAVINLLFIVALPVWGASRFQKHKRWIHLFESILCWVFPLLVLIGTIAAIRRYRISNQPEFCHPNSLFAILTLYTPGVLFCLFNGTAIPVVIGVLLQRHFKLQKMIGHGNVGMDWVAQMAVFTVAFSIEIWLVMLDFTVKEIQEPSYGIYLAQYSKCVTIFGAYGTNCCQPLYRNYYNSALGVSSGLFSSVWGVAGLSALAYKDVRKLWRRILTCNNCCHGYK